MMPLQWSLPPGQTNFRIAGFDDRSGVDVHHRMRLRDQHWDRPTPCGRARGASQPTKRLREQCSHAAESVAANCSPRGSAVSECAMSVGGAISISALTSAGSGNFLHALEVDPSVQTVHAGAFPLGRPEKKATKRLDVGSRTTTISCDQIGNCTASRTYGPNGLAELARIVCSGTHNSASEPRPVKRGGDARSSRQVAQEAGSV